MQPLLALDWGTSSFRAYLLDTTGCIVAQKSSPAGILQSANQGFAATLQQELAHFAPALQAVPNLHIIAAGMITSRNGWLETPYVPCPASLDQLAAAVRSHSLHGLGNIHFCPGVCQHEPLADIMRGEETQIVGLDLPENALVLLPGTHSKWVHVKRGTIVSFTTYMTGDLFAALTRHTILQDHGNDWQEAIFLEALETGRAAAQGNTPGLLAGLFHIRARQILAQHETIHTKEWVSGLLIGAEVTEALRQPDAISMPIYIVGDIGLAQHYQKALAHFGLSCRLAPNHSAARGLYRIAQHRGVLHNHAKR